jgi:tetratricopeptide (TPR) repeat protein
MNLLRRVGVALLAATVVVGCAEVKEAALERGVTLFLENHLDEAHKVLQASTQLSPEDPDGHAWLAECLRRLNRYDEAADHAHRALKIDPRNAFAHTVLGDLYNVHYSMWGRTDDDSSWFHLRQAVTYDPDDGNAWSSIWVQAMKREDEFLEKKAAAMMITSGFLAEPILAYNRWQLRNLPEGAILLTNGDMDTFPSVALQHKEGMRPDVAVVNLSLLNLAWYAAMIAERYDIPLPFEPDRIASLKTARDTDGRVITPSMQIASGWFDMKAEGNLTRPLCTAITVNDVYFTPEMEERRVFAGPCYEIMPTSGQEADIKRVATALDGIDAAEFEGSFASPLDRSPVRRTATDKVGTNVTAAMLRHAGLLAEEGSWQEAATVLARAEAFDSRLMASGHFRDHMDSLEAVIQEHLSE